NPLLLSLRRGTGASAARPPPWPPPRPSRPPRSWAATVPAAASSTTTPTSHRSVISFSLFRRVARINDDVLHLADAVAAPMLGRVLVLLRLEAGDRLLE